MELTVKEEAHNIHLRIPTGMLLNRGTAFALCPKAQKHGITITHRQAVEFLKALHDYRRTHKEWVLVEVKGAKGEYVQIKL